jgi:hypothetical protein
MKYHLDIESDQLVIGMDKRRRHDNCLVAEAKKEEGTPT